MIYGNVDTRLREGETGALPPVDPASFGDVFSSAFDAQLKAYNLNSSLATKEKAFDDTIDGLFELTGQRLENPMRAPWIEVVDGIRVPRRSDPILAFEQRLEALANEQPDKARHILALRGSVERAYATRNEAVRVADDATMRSPWTGNVPLLGPVNPAGLAGGMAGSLLDPATLIVNAVGSAGAGGKLLYHAARSALINAGAEVAQQPFIKQWANEAGDPYGWDDAARGVAAAALLGGAIDAGIRGGFRGAQRARGLEPVREGGLITGWRSPAEKIAALDDAVPRLPEDNPVRRAFEGDTAAARQVAEVTGAIEDPAVRGELMAREMSDGLEGPPPMDVDAGDGFARLAQALRNATDPDEPPAPAGPPPAVSRRTQPDAANIPAALDEAFGLAGRILPEGTRVDVVPDMVEPVSGQAVDAVAIQGNIRLSALALDPKARVGHEGVHVLVQRGLLTAEEVEVLAAAARKAGAFSDEADARYRQAYANRDNVDLLIAEEAAAAFVEGRVRAVPEVQSIIDKITQFLDRLRNALGGRGFRNADDVSRAILSGKVARRSQAGLEKAAGTDLVQASGVAAGIDDFASSVSSLKSRLGVKTRQRTFDQGSFALREDADAVPFPQAIENATGPKIPVIMSYIAKFGTDGDEITTSVRRALALDISNAGVADLQKFIVALEDMQQIIENRLQAGYKLSEDVQSVRDKIDERFDDVIARIDEIDNEAGNIKWDLSNRADELDERYDELLDARFGDDEAAREAYLDSLPSSDLPSLFQRLPEMDKGTSVLQVVEIETPVATVFVTDHISRAKRLLEADPEKMDLPEIERALDEANSLLTALDSAEIWAQGLSKLAEEKRAGGLDLIDGLQDEKLSPVLDRLEGHADEIDGKVTEAEDLLTARQEGSAMYALSGEDRRQRAADALARTPQVATHAALLGARSAPAPGPRLVDVAGAEAKAQTDSLERALASSIEAVKSEVLRERATAIAGDGDPLQVERRVSIAAGRYVHTHAAAERMTEIRAEIDKAAKMLPADVRVRVRDRLDGGDLDGAWDGYDRIIYLALDAPDPKATLRHEAIHALRQTGLMTDQEFNTLYAFAERIGLREAAEIDARYGDAYGKAYADRGKAGVEALLREETIAEMFAAHQSGRRFGKDALDRAGGRTVDKIFDAISKFLARVREMLTGKKIASIDDIFEAIETGAMAARDVRRTTLPGGIEIEGFELFSLKAFHGTPHAFEPEPGAPAGRFRSDRIGSGEGAQVFGRGLYFTESEKLGRWYQTRLSAQKNTPRLMADGVHVESFEAAREVFMDSPYERQLMDYDSGEWTVGASVKISKEWTERALAEWEGFLLRHTGLEDYTRGGIEFLKQISGKTFSIEKAPENKGRLYEVIIDVDEDRLLLWDRPLNSQPGPVAKALKAGLGKELGAHWLDALKRALSFGSKKDTGHFAVADKAAAGAYVAKGLKSNAQRMTDLLKSFGIEGIKYLDAGSRKSGDGTFNYVIFDDSKVEIVAVDGQPVVNLAADLADAKRETGLGKVVEACRF